MLNQNPHGSVAALREACVDSSVDSLIAAHGGPVDPILRTANNVRTRLADSVRTAPGESVADALGEVPWVLEEFRTSYFAQQLGTAYPISAKRILRAIDNA